MWQVEWQVDKVPEEILRRADFVERDKGEGLREESCGEVVLCEREGQEERGQEDLWEESEAGEVNWGWSAGGPGRGEVEEGVVGGEVVAVVEARDMV